nr:MAG TPA: hypothetical protein [Bacteriophage sp.]
MCVPARQGSLRNPKILLIRDKHYRSVLLSEMLADCCC